MFDWDKVYHLHFLVKHLKSYFLKDVFPMGIAPWGNLVLFSWGKFILEAPFSPRGKLFPKGI
jgi:hypothetical protein